MNKMQKFLIVHYSIKGQERWGRTFPIAKALAKQRYEVTLLTTANKNQCCLMFRKEIVDGVTVISFSDILPMFILSKGLGFLSFLFRIIFSLSHKFDYVYSDCGETPNSGWPCKINQWIYGSKYISEWGDLLGRGGYYDSKPGWFKFFFGRYYLWAERFFRRSADYIVVLSSFMKDHAISRGIRSERIILLPGGALVDVLSEAEFDKSSICLNENIITLGYIGVDDREIMDLIPLTDAIRSNKHGKQFKVVLFGKKINDSIIYAHHLKDVIIECGWIDYYRDQGKLRVVDIFILMKSNNLLSKSGWPNKLGDYMSIARPVLITPYGDIEQFVEEYPDGFIQITTDRNVLEEVLNKIIEQDFDFKKMGHSNRLIAERKISWDKRISNLLLALGITYSDAKPDMVER